MRTRHLRRAGAAFAALALVLAACGDDDAGTAAGAPTDDTAGMDGMNGDQGHGDHGDHDHGAVDVADWAAVPTVSIDATPDAKAGVNVRIDTENFTFAPERASTGNVEGEGHGHIYVDGEKVGRVYGDWFHLDGLAPGDHEVTVDLNANDHSALEFDGEAIADTVTVTVPEKGEGHGHSHGDDGREAAAPAPTVSIEVIPDAKSGYNVRVDTTDFAFAPERASGEAVDGEGHGHLYVDGVKVARLYTPWFHLGPLDPGNHEITVSLNGNDHVALLDDGEPIEASQTVAVEGEAPAETADQIIEVMVMDGDITGGGRIPVSLGDEVLVRITADTADEVHLHGYDLLVALEAGVTAELRFDADIPGVFELELHDARLPLAELEIS